MPYGVGSSILIDGKKLNDNAPIIHPVNVYIPESKIQTSAFLSRLSNAYIENAIIDKDVVINDGVRLVGSVNNPVIIKKGEII